MDQEKPILEYTNSDSDAGSRQPGKREWITLACAFISIILIGVGIFLIVVGDVLDEELTKTGKQGYRPPNDHIGLNFSIVGIIVTLVSAGWLTYLWLYSPRYPDPDEMDDAPDSTSDS